MHITSETFWLPKSGNAADEYEDAAWPIEPVSYNFDSFRAAVADGATEASFSGLWAQLLVEAYKDDLLEGDSFAANVTELQQRWKAKVGEAPLPWYAEQKLESGAFAALVGLTIHDSIDGTQGEWSALAIGDSCLFHISGEQLLASVPIVKAEEFNSRPALMCSTPTNNIGFMERIRVCTGKYVAGDRFILMSDALACWFLKSWELQADPLGFLDAIVNADDFAKFVEQQRTDLIDGESLLKNDDMTFVRIKVAVP